ncbi:hypothetical protein Lal_00018528 [Lupinus albus]|nr:hypothetical protein Lal_00018528 [Lupinus albus]
MSTISLHSILETSKLVGTNYDVWYRNLRIVLMHERLLNIIHGPAMAALVNPYNGESIKVYEKYKEYCLNAKCVILTSMSSELQRSSIPTNDQVGPHVLKMIDLIE